jgi:hypothetical protein
MPPKALGKEKGGEAGGREGEDGIDESSLLLVCRRVEQAGA